MSAARLDMYVNYEHKASFKLDEVETVIGRDPHCKVTIPDAKVSRKHTTIWSRNSKIFIENTGVNGTKVNGREISSSIELLPGDVVFIANYILVYQTKELAEQDLDSTILIDGSPSNICVQ